MKRNVLYIYVIYKWIATMLNEFLCYSLLHLPSSKLAHCNDTGRGRCCFTLLEEQTVFFSGSYPVNF